MFHKRKSCAGYFLTTLKHLIISILTAADSLFFSFFLNIFFVICVKWFNWQTERKEGMFEVVLKIIIIILLTFVYMYLTLVLFCDF